MNMKEYRPLLLISMPSCLLALLQYFLFLFVFFMVITLKLDRYLFNSPIMVNVWWLIFFSIMFWTYKILGTYTAVDRVKFDFENKLLTIKYWKYYIYRRVIEIRFSDLSYKNRYDTLLYLGGSIALLIYNKNRLKVKLNSRNGWKNRQIDEITKDLLLIKPPDRPLTERPF